MKTKGLYRYIEITKLIRELSTPQIHSDMNAIGYRRSLLESYQWISELARINNDILENELNDFFNTDSELTLLDVQDIKKINSLLVDAVSLETIDVPMIYKIAFRLCEITKDKKYGLDIRLSTLDSLLIASYMMLSMTERFYPWFDICFKYRDVGIEAGKEILEYLEIDKFKEIDNPEIKELILIDSRYISTLFDWRDKDNLVEYNDYSLDMMEESIALADSIEIRQLAPHYRWNYHIFRALQYISGFLDYNNLNSFTSNQSKRVLQYTNQLKEHIQKNIPNMEEQCTKNTQRFYLARAKYYANELSTEDYKQELKDIYLTTDISHYAIWELFTKFMPILEYIGVCDREHLSDSEQEFIASFYNSFTSYAYRMPKTGAVTFVYTWISYFVKSFIEIDGSVQFDDFCLQIISALHPPTYVHILCVTDLIVDILEIVFERKAEVLIGLCHTKTKEEVLERKEEIVEFARKGSLLHDVGKIFVLETIINYGRDLFDFEKDMLQLHTTVGYELLKSFSSTKDYANMAIGHHKWYDNSNGYPKDFDIQKCPERELIAILTVADCLDASTDEVGRSYKESKDISSFLKELKDHRGSQYADWLVDILDDEEIIHKIENRLIELREKNYKITFEKLKLLTTK